MAQRKKQQRRVSLYYRDEDKIWRKINAKVYIFNNKPRSIIVGGERIELPE